MNKPLKLVLLAGNTLRARAYAQQLEALNHADLDINALFFGFNQRKSPSVDPEELTNAYFQRQDIFIPDLNEDIRTTFNRQGWNSKNVDTDDVNSESVLEALASFDADIFVFAGYGGQILKAPHFSDGRQYLHMHPGKLPIERGSTTLYYSMLNQRPCTVTAFYMTEKIDAGENILYKEYPVPGRGVNTDLWFDNVIRADCFKHAVLAILEGNYHYDFQGDSEEYYVIHPVLKHVALLSMK